MKYSGYFIDFQWSPHDVTHRQRTSMLAVSLIEKVLIVTFLMGFSGTKYKPRTVQVERRKHGPAVLLQALRGTPRINTTTPTYKIQWCAMNTPLHQQVTLGSWARSMIFFFLDRAVLRRWRKCIFRSNRLRQSVDCGEFRSNVTPPPSGHQTYTSTHTLGYTGPVTGSLYLYTLS